MRTRDVLRWVGALALALAIAGLAGAQLVRGAPAPSREMTFIDHDRGYALVLQVEPAATDAGAFVFRVPGRGLYRGTVGAAMRVLSPTSVVVRYEGPALLGPHTGYGESGSPQPAPRTVQIRLQAQVNPTQRTAEATLTEGAERFHLVARTVSKGDLAQTLRTFEAATLAADWATLYGLMNRDIRAAYTPAAFADQGARQVALAGRVVGLRRGTVGEVQTTDGGVSSVSVAYTVEVRAPGGTLTSTGYDALFIPEGAAWKVWLTGPRP